VTAEPTEELWKPSTLGHSGGEEREHTALGHPSGPSTMGEWTASL
jgi:hypothetical protein